MNQHTNGWKVGTPTYCHADADVTKISFGDINQAKMTISYTSRSMKNQQNDWVGAQADLSLRWCTCHFVGFVMQFIIPV